MIPRSLEIEGIRSFITPRTIDFSDLHLFAILGDTGAGKSSILEAIVYALYNSTTWDARGVKELMSTGASRMRVRFRFALEGRTYVVSRSTPRTGAAHHLLECEGFAEERRDNERAVTARIEELLGLTRETFIKTVVLPQGEFAALLALSEKHAERTRLLTAILALDQLDAMAEALVAPREIARARHDHLGGARARLPADPAAAIAQVQAAIGDARALRASLDGALARFDEHAAAQAALDQAAGRRTALRAQLARVPVAVDRLHAIDRRSGELDALIADAEARCRETIETVSALDARHAEHLAAGTESSNLQRVHETLGRLLDAHAERECERGERQARSAAFEGATATAQERTVAAAQAEAAMIAAEQRFEAARRARTSAQDLFNAAREARDRLAAARAALDEAQTHVGAATAEVEAASAAELAAATEHAAAATALEAADAALSHAQRCNAAAAAARNLPPGAACPVCDRQLPASFVPPPAADLVQAEAALRSARERDRAATQRMGQAQARVRSASLSLQQARDAELARRAERDAAADQARAAGIDADADPASALARFEHTVGEHQATLTAAEEARLAATGVSSEARATLAAAREALARATGELMRTDAALARRDLSIATLREQLDSRFSPAVQDGFDAIAAARDAAARSLAEARALDDQRHAAREAASTAAAERSRLAARQAAEIQGPLHAVRAELHAAVSALVPPSAANVKLAADTASVTEVCAWADSLVSVAASVQRAADDDERSDALRSREVGTAMSAILSAHDVNSREELGARRDLALQQEAVANDALRSASDAAQEAADLDAQLGRIAPFAAALEELHAKLRDGQFKRFVAERKERHLLGVATTVLRRMTEGRFGFGAGMRIVDNLSGHERSPHTLSGGEKFLASLALAFALVEIASRSGGQFGALFLDEGFGSLDPHALDEALAELERQASGGRMIGVITHVREVSDYIDDVLRVQRTASGSEVTRLGRSDAEALLAESTALALAAG